MKKMITAIAMRTISEINAPRNAFLPSPPEPVAIKTMPRIKPNPGKKKLRIAIGLAHPASAECAARFRPLKYRPHLTQKSMFSFGSFAPQYGQNFICFTLLFDFVFPLYHKMR